MKDSTAMLRMDIGCKYGLQDLYMLGADQKNSMSRAHEFATHHEGGVHESWASCFCLPASVHVEKPLDAILELISSLLGNCSGFFLLLFPWKLLQKRVSCRSL